MKSPQEMSPQELEAAGYEFKIVKDFRSLQGEKGRLLNDNERLSQAWSGLQNMLTGLAMPAAVLGLVQSGHPGLAIALGVPSIIGTNVMAASVFVGATKIIDAIKGNKNTEIPHAIID